MTERVGRKFSNSTVTDSEMVGVSPSGRRRYKFTLRCSCGNVYELSEKALGRAIEPCATCRPTQRGANLRQHKLYATWAAMHNRCSNPNDAGYKNYGGRGITVCDSWRGCDPAYSAKKSIIGFIAFLTDMGDRPTGHSLDRRDNDGPYAPWNCRWASGKTQSANRSENIWVTLGGVRKRFNDWADDFRVDPEKLRSIVHKSNKTPAYVLGLLQRKRAGVRLPKSARSKKAE